MTKVAYFDSKGECKGVSYFVYKKDAVSSGGYLIDEENSISDDEFIETCYLKDGAIKKREAKPSPFCEWNPAAEKWDEDINAGRDNYLRKIDRNAEEVRAKFITSTPGQSMTYEAKHQEACRWPNDSPFPWLESEAEALGTTPQAVADSILAARAKWETAGIAIERARLKAKAEVRSADTAAEMHAALERMRITLPGD